MQVDGSVLVRKMRQGGVARSPLPDTDMIGDAFARQTEDRLRPHLKCASSASVHECRVMRLGDAAAEIGTPAMIGLVTLEQAETHGLIAMDSTLVWHTTDLVLGGSSAEAGQPTPRSFTAIDAAISRPPLQALAGAFGAAVAAVLGRPLPLAFTLADLRHTIAQIRIAPDYVDVLKIRLDLCIGEAARTGRVDVILPLATLDIIRAALAKEGAAEARDRPNDLWRAAMRRAAAGATVTLDAVIHRERMTLAELRQLTVGQVIEIDPDAPRAIEIRLAQPGGRVALIANAQLGGYEENKVVRLGTEPDRRLAAHISRALYPAAPMSQAQMHLEELATSPALPRPPASDQSSSDP